jgi:hypothetical protein
MKRTNKAPKLTLQRTTLAKLSAVQGGIIPGMYRGPKSFDANCSGSCNTCVDIEACGGQWYSAVDC